MLVSNIIYQVRESLDEQSGTTDFVDTYLDNIIKAKVYDALRWVLLYADASLLNDTSSAPASDGSIAQADVAVENGIVKLDPDFVRLIRIRMDGWYKAVMTTIEEDSDEYLMQSDDTAKADNTRPVVALIRIVPNQLELFPHVVSGTAHITYVKMSSAESDGTISDSADIPVPTKLISAYIYYICYLVMIAHDDTSKAANMLATAKMNAGITSTSSSN